jgi:ATP-dependent RNA helicase DHX8/PRP22
LITIPGRQFPVDIMYVNEPEPDYIDAAMLTCLQIHKEEDPGGVLLFLPGQDDIESLQVTIYLFVYYLTINILFIC